MAKGKFRVVKNPLIGGKRAPQISYAGSGDSHYRIEVGRLEINRKPANFLELEVDKNNKPKDRYFKNLFDQGCIELIEEPKEEIKEEKSSKSSSKIINFGGEK